MMFKTMWENKKILVLSNENLALLYEIDDIEKSRFSIYIDLHLHNHVIE